MDRGARLSRLLVVEDERRIAAFLVKGLRAAGYSVDHAESVADGIALTRAHEFALVVLDRRLPDGDGLAVLETLRAAGSEVPVIVLTARGDLADRVEGLDLGADDYLTKPFAFDELLARIRARLRRHDTGAKQAQLAHAGVELDLLTRHARVAGREVELTAREFALLETFLRHPGQVLSREQLLSQVWGIDFDPESNLVDVYVGYLRRKLGDGAITTVRGAGYRLVGSG